LLDYALGNDLGLPPISVKLAFYEDPLGGPATLHFSYPVSVNAQNVTLTALYSTDLVSWHDGAAQLELISRDSLEGGRELCNWRIKPPLSEQPRVFLRLKATVR
jgi:hypothetical protein